MSFLTKAFNFVKSWQFVAGFACGAVAVLAVPALGKLFAPVAKVIPGSKA